jgi:metal-responsive CopG/Arc/MetJ family transcriptional regulator
MGKVSRGERLQIMLTNEELSALDDWRFKTRMPSRASAVRELLRRGLMAEGFALAKQGRKSQAFGVLNAAAQAPKRGGENGTRAEADD